MHLVGVVDDIDESVCSRDSLKPQSFSASVGSWNKWFIGGYLYLVWAGGVVGEGGWNCSTCSGVSGSVPHGQSSVRVTLIQSLSMMTSGQLHCGSSFVKQHSSSVSKRKPAVKNGKWKV